MRITGGRSTPEEVEVVREIFRLFVNDRMIPRIIAERLNEQGILSEYGRPWTRSMIQTLVTNPKYIGANVLNRRTYRLGSTGRNNPKDKWIIRENTFQPLIDATTFRKAQEIAASRYPRYTNEQLLQLLQGLLARTGKLSIAIIDGDNETPNSRLYSSRFGTIFEAYRRIGYDHGRPIPVIELALELRRFRRKLLSSMADELRAEGATVGQDCRSGLLRINEEFTLRLVTAPCLHKAIGHRWALRLSSTMKTDLTVVARMVPTNDSVLDYYLLPRAEAWPPYVTVPLDDDLFVGVCRFGDLTFLRRLARRTRLEEKG